ncbi:ABCB family ABC transporter ATP-binding protein/permease [Radicibacter daui]|uniref:ABCB family ABC transporter ATP-binding protein/permease n=1 Tax=Radicibacter daui TaxID=3064829 RepID=UPI004046E458
MRGMRMRGGDDGHGRREAALELGALGNLMPYLWPRGEREMRLRVVIAMSFLIAGKIIGVYVPYLYKMVIDAVSPHAGPLTVIPIGLIVAYGLANIGSLAFNELRDAVFAKVAQRAIRRVGLAVFAHLHRLSLRFHLDRRTGGLSRSIERGTRGIDTLLRFMLFNILPTLAEIALVTVVLWGLLDAAFALVTLGTVVIYIAYTIIVTAWRLQFRKVMNEQDSKANTKAIDSLLNFETVKYFGNERHEVARYDEGLAAYEKAAVRSLTSLSLLNIGQSAIISLGTTVVMLMAARGIAGGTLTSGDMVMVVGYLMQLYRPLGFFGFVYREIKQALVDIDDMFELLDQKQEVQDVASAPALAVTGGSIAFEGVEFGYDARRPILKGVSFTVPAGGSVAIVGPTGAGKSTISRLLFRFYDVTGGRITVDGQDIRGISQESLRGSLGIVPQDTVLFNDTVYYNIAYGRPSATRAEVEAAARLAHIHDFVMSLPDGYETMVGERGLKLSGGEKQRVAIARTILKDPPIILFDEATSALDTHTEKQIQTNLREVSRGRTTLMIAHRLSTVVEADQIIVLEGGVIVERGTHGELLDLGAKYAELWQRQLEAGEGEQQAAE